MVPTADLCAAHGSLSPNVGVIGKNGADLLHFGDLERETYHVSFPTSWLESVHDQGVIRICRRAEA